MPEQLLYEVVLAMPDLWPCQKQGLKVKVRRNKSKLGGWDAGAEKGAFQSRTAREPCAGWLSVVVVQ